MTNPHLLSASATRSPAWTRDHVLGCLLFGVGMIETEGHARLAAEIRHLAMLWYTGARRASPGGRGAGPLAPGDIRPKVRRRPRPVAPSVEADLETLTLEKPETGH